MSQATIERRLVQLMFDFQKARKVWGDLASDGITQANALVNATLQQSYVDSPGYWPPALIPFVDLKERFELKLQAKADAHALSLETTFNKMCAQYSKMKLQISQMEYLMEEACETFGEDFVYLEPLKTTCTLEQLVIQAQMVFGYFSDQMTMNRHVFESLVRMKDQRKNGQLLAIQLSGIEKSFSLPKSAIPTTITTTSTTSNPSISPSSPPSLSSAAAAAAQFPILDKDQAMILLSAWLNQPRIKTEQVAVFDELIQVELLA